MERVGIGVRARLQGFALWKAGRGFIRWWGTELWACLPQGTHQLISPHVLRIILDFDEGTVGAIECRGSQGKDLGRFPFQSDAPLPKDLLSLLGSHVTKGTEVEIRLPQAIILHKSLTLPREAEHNLRAVLGYDMDRQTPFRADEVYYDYEIVEHSPQSKELNVLLTIAPRAYVDAILETVTKWGLRPVVVSGVGQGGCGKPHINLLPPEERLATVPIWSGLNRALLASALVLSVAATVLPFQHQKAVIQDLEQRIAVLKGEAEAAQSSDAKISSLLEQSRQAAEQKNKSIVLVELLSELSRVIPDDTWLERMEVKEKELELYGISSNASALIELLEGTQVLQKVRFSATTVRDPASGRDRFRIKAELTRGMAS